MRLPRFESAVVDPVKLLEYLLSPSHDRGRFKAAVFASMGYSQHNSAQFEADIRQLIAEVDASPVRSGPHGQKFVAAGTLAGPTGRPRRIRTVWIILSGESVPRLLTAYPETQP
jgi:hypothetical protein